MSKLIEKLILLSLMVYISVSMVACGTAFRDGFLSDGYQFGDLTREAFRLQNEFCAVGDEKARVLLLAAAKRAGVKNPDIICNMDLIELLEGE